MAAATTAAAKQGATSSPMTHQGQRVGFTAGSSYQGGLGEGEATFVFSDGTTYEGQWVDNKYDGQGKAQYKSADNKDSYYEGEFKANLQEGQGKQTWASGSSYEGEWRAGRLHGHGVYTLAGTTMGVNVYEGQWERGMKHGRGKYTIHKKNAVLEEYDGQWKGNRRHGKGVCSYGGPIKPAALFLMDRHGELEMGTYEGGYRAGEGVRWSADRSQVWQLQAGRALKEIELAEAEAFAESLGFSAPSQAEDTETGNAQLQQTKTLD